MPRIVKPYKKYIIIYMDILGFREKVNKSRNSRKNTEDISRILREADSLAMTITKNYKAMNVKAGIFSDTILLTCPTPDFIAVESVLQAASIYQIALMTRGFFLRGSAVIDSHYSRYKANISFGPSIIRALDVEKLAVWPRIVAAPHLMSNLDPISVKRSQLLMRQLDLDSLPTLDAAFLERLYKTYTELFDNVYLPRSGDGLRYIDYLKIGFAYLTSMRWLSEYKSLDMPDFINIDLLPVHRDAILKAAKVCEAANDTKTLTKYHSLATYHNEVIDSLRNSLSESFDPDTLSPLKYLDCLYSYCMALFSTYGITISKSAMNDFLIQKIKVLSQGIADLEKHKIQLPETFPTLYS